MILLKISILFLFIITIIPFISAEETSILSQVVSDNSYLLNSTDPNDLGEPIGGFYLLVGKDVRELEAISTIKINTPNIQKSDFWNDVTIDSVTLKLLVVLEKGAPEKYFLTAHICVDNFEKKLTNRWLRGLSDALPFSFSRDLKNHDCKITSPQDSVVIHTNDLPRIFELDVTNLTRELIKFESGGLVYVLTAIPINENLPNLYSVPPSSDGFLAIASKDSESYYGSNSVAILEIVYLTNPTNNAETLNQAYITIPAILAIGVPVALYWLSQNRLRREVLERARNSILRELDGNIDALSGQRGYQVMEYDLQNNDGTINHVRYTNAFLDIDAYNSLLASGEFTRFQVDTQDVLRELYTRINDHNDFIKYTNNIEDQITIQRRTIRPQEITGRYEINLTRLENEINTLIPQVLNQLQMEI